MLGFVISFDGDLCLGWGLKVLVIDILNLSIDVNNSLNLVAYRIVVIHGSAVD